MPKTRHAMRKAEQRETLRERARRAILNLYHNATPSYPRNVADSDVQLFQDWFDDAARFEVEYVQDGGPYMARNEREYVRDTLRPLATSKFKSESARKYYVKRESRIMQEEVARFPWSRISEYGKLYTWGRGGRTLAPDNLVSQRGGSPFRLREDYADEMSNRELVRFIQTVESFNAYVTEWCESVPDMWHEYKSEMDADLAEETAKEMARDIAESRPDLQPIQE